MVCMLSKGIKSITTTSPASEVHNPTYISLFVPCLGTIPLINNNQTNEGPMEEVHDVDDGSLVHAQTIAIVTRPMETLATAKDIPRLIKSIRVYRNETLLFDGDTQGVGEPEWVHTWVAPDSYPPQRSGRQARLALQERLGGRSRGAGLPEDLLDADGAL